MSSRSRSVTVVQQKSGATAKLTDAVAVEDPLEIRLADTPLAVVMRTPGDDEDLVRGFFLTEGILLNPDEVQAVDRIDQSRVSVRLKEGMEIDAAQFQRNMFASSSCGVCGKASIESVQLLAPPAKPFTLKRTVAVSLTDRLRDHQPTFETTGGLHAAGLFDLSGQVLAVREDVGRHNAVDKAIGAATRHHWPLPPAILVVSGRQSFEIIQKAAMVGIGGVIGVSAPSSLAVELAGALGMLLIGFSRGDGFNVYAGSERLSE